MPHFKTTHKSRNNSTPNKEDIFSGETNAPLTFNKTNKNTQYVNFIKQTPQNPKYTLQNIKTDKNIFRKVYLPLIMSHTT